MRRMQNAKTDAAAIVKRTPAILVATPGRLNDLLANYDGVHSLFDGLCALVLDEADQLLDMGFRPDIEKILNALQVCCPLSAL